MKLIIAEKPTQADDIRNAVSSEYKVVSAVGHILELGFGESKWTLETLPIIPKQSIINNHEIENYTLKSEKKELYEKIKRELDKNPSEIICATDPDFEGEAIYRTIIEYYQLQGGKVTNNQKRLILKDNTIEGIQTQMKQLKSIEEYDGWRKRAYARAYSDALVGFNGTRVITLNSGNGDIIPIGRVITPTLKMIVDRYFKNKNHVKEYTYAFDIKFDDIMLSSVTQRFNTKRELIEYINKLADNVLISVNSKTKELTPPKLHNLSSLQKVMNKKHKIKANETSKALQYLYYNKYTSYPRTDCTVLTKDTAEQLKKIIEENREELVNEYKFNLSSELNYNKQIIGKTSAHEGITIKNIPQSGELTKIQQQVYEEILQVNIANFSKNMEIYEEEITTVIDNHVYKAKFTKDISDCNNSWNLIYDSGIKFNLNESLKNCDNKNIDAKFIEKEIESKPKPLYTEGTLINAMEGAGKEEEDYKKLFKEIQGIGTPATRSGIIENLYNSNYITNQKDKVIPTEKGIDLIELLDIQNNPLVNISYTAEIELKLRELEENPDKSFDEFINYIILIVNDIIDASNNNKVNLKGTGPKKLGACPMCKESQVTEISGKYGKFYACSDKTCSFKVPSYYKFTDKDIEKILAGKKSGIKKQKSKQGKEYRCKYYLNGEKIERDFVN